MFISCSDGQSLVVPAAAFVGTTSAQDSELHSCIGAAVVSADSVVVLHFLLSGP